VIPWGQIDEWRQQAPWSQDLQVEQDLILSRALVELFEQPAVARSLALRGGTALFKLQIRPALRYSEDIDLVQLTAEPIGPTLDAIRHALATRRRQPDPAELAAQICHLRDWRIASLVEVLGAPASCRHRRRRPVAGAVRPVVEPHLSAGVMLADD
jgi:hypothetical protein